MFLFTYICLASRYPEAIPLKRATAQEYAEELLDIFARNGVPNMILSDQGCPFMGYLMKCQRQRSCSLTIPLSKDSYRLQRHASGTGIGAVLCVVRNNEEYHSNDPHSSEVAFW